MSKEYKIFTKDGNIHWMATWDDENYQGLDQYGNFVRFIRENIIKIETRDRY